MESSRCQGVESWIDFGDAAREQKEQSGEEPMIIGVVSESFPGERRVALTPGSVPSLTKVGAEVLIQTGAGENAGYPDDLYQEKGATLISSRSDVFERSNVMVHLLGLGANPEAGQRDLPLYRSGQAALGFFRPLDDPESIKELADTGVTAFSIEMLPRITRAQSMDALSAMANIAGYKAVLLAADNLPRMFPMLMTAAGTIAPAKVLVVGVGVAGLQAIATAKRLGAVVSAYDIRPAVKEQVQSLGAKFVELPLEATEAEDAGGYARAQGAEFIEKQQELMAKVVKENDVVITTANVPGRKAPVLVTESMVAGMKPGSVIVDLAAERGGNCEATRPGETVLSDGVTVLGPLNPAGLIPYHASQMYSSNITALLLHLIKNNAFATVSDDEITQETQIARDGRITNQRVQEALEGIPKVQGVQS